MDGNEKLQQMGLAIYGLIDKFSRMFISLTVVPNARHELLPVMCFLRYVRNLKGKSSYVDQ